MMVLHLSMVLSLKWFIPERPGVAHSAQVIQTGPSSAFHEFLPVCSAFVAGSFSGTLSV